MKVTIKLCKLDFIQLKPAAVVCRNLAWFRGLRFRSGNVVECGLAAGEMPVHLPGTEPFIATSIN